MSHGANWEMLTCNLKRRNKVKAKLLLHKLCKNRAACGQSPQNTQNCTLRPLDFWEVFFHLCSEISLTLGVSVSLGSFVFFFFNLGKTYEGPSPQLLRPTKNWKGKKTEALAHSSLHLLWGFCCPNPISLQASALQEPQPCWKHLPRPAESSGAGLSAKGQKANSSSPSC